MDSELMRLRGEIDRVDEEILTLFAERMRLVGEIGARKDAGGLPLRDEARERALLDRLSASAGDEMSPYVSELYERILALSRAYQEELLKR